MRYDKNAKCNVAGNNIIQSLVAGEPLSAFLVVYKQAGEVFAANHTSVSQSLKVIGLTLQNVILGANVNVLLFGEVSDASFIFIEGESIFLSGGGTLTQVTLGLQNVLKVGRAIDVDKILFDIELLIMR